MSLGNYIPFTEEDKLRAGSVDLVRFLEEHGEPLKREGSQYRMKNDTRITLVGNEWYNQYEEFGGGPITFVQKVLGKSYQEGMLMLLGASGVLNFPGAMSKKEKESVPFQLPPANENMRRTYAYLLKERHLSREVVNRFVKAGLVYESCETSKDGTKTYRNAVFVGKDRDGVARHACKRGIYSGSSFRGDVPGGDPRCSFHWVGGNGRLYVFEAAIDLLAYATLHPDRWWEHSYVSLDGVTENALLWMLETYPNLEQVVFCLDHDEGGIEATGKLRDILAARVDRPLRTEVRRPDYKDWDECLKAQYGVEAIPGTEHPQVTACVDLCKELKVHLQKPAEKPASLKELAALNGGLRRETDNGHRLELSGQGLVGARLQGMAAVALRAVREQLGSLGRESTEVELLRDLYRQFRPYKNKCHLSGKLDELHGTVCALEKLSQLPPGNNPEEERRRRETAAQLYQEAALHCVEAGVRVNLECQKLLVAQQDRHAMVV